uniref:MotA/TolQ/ExbB proton channel domain-containing protein n=2 Tax=Paenibacillus athensensis TaxID=1967502 RepID=A0A4Y8Q7A5_9BACL
MARQKNSESIPIEKQDEGRVNPALNMMYWALAGTVAGLCAAYEAGKTIVLWRRIDAPLFEFHDEWRTKSRALRYKRNLVFHKELYAYRRFSEEELLHTHIYLKSYDNDSSYWSAVVDLVGKLVLPISVFLLGSALAISNNVFGVVSRSADASAAQTLPKILELFQVVTDNTAILMLLTGLLFITGLVNAAAKAARKRKIQLHLLLVEAALQEAKAQKPKAGGI